MLNYQIRRCIKLLVVCLITIGANFWLAAASGADAVSDARSITVYRDPACSCCGSWMNNLKAQGFQTRNVPRSDMDAVKQQYGVPGDLASCHTAVINGYVVEGHVPTEDIKQLIAKQPNVVGIAVPGMPVGTPGMEAGEVREPFTVFSFNKQGHSEAINQY